MEAAAQVMSYEVSRTSSRWSGKRSRELVYSCFKRFTHRSHLRCLDICNLEITPHRKRENREGQENVDDCATQEGLGIVEAWSLRFWMPRLLGRKTWSQRTDCKYNSPDYNNDNSPQRHLLKATGSEDSPIKEENTKFDTSDG